MGKMSLTEATMLALQGKLVKNNNKLNESKSKKVEDYKLISDMEKQGDKSYLDKKSAIELYDLWQKTFNLKNQFINNKELYDELSKDCDYWHSRLESLHEEKELNDNIETLTEKENKENREINAKIRQGYDYIDDLKAQGLQTWLSIYSLNIVEGDGVNEDEVSDRYNFNLSDNADYMWNIPSKQVLDDFTKEFPRAEYNLLISTGNPDENAGYNVDSKILFSSKGAQDINKDTDIFTFLNVVDDREFAPDGELTDNDINYRKNAKYSEDPLKDNTSRLRRSVKRDLDDYKNTKDLTNKLPKEIDKLQKTNSDFNNDKQILDKSSQLKQAKNKLNRMSKDDGTFDVDGARQEYKRYGNRTI